MSAFYNYMEPFSCECRAFSRLREAGREELAIRCFGYVLLDEEHERAMRTRFPDVDIEWAGYEDNRGRFLGRNDRLPPFRCIIKQFGLAYKEEEEGEEGDGKQRLQPPVLRKMLRDIRALQQLGIIRLDVSVRQLVDGKISDFSHAVTVPHFITTPELNPHLTPSMRSAAELETFILSYEDYSDFDTMVTTWNRKYATDGEHPESGQPVGRIARRRPIDGVPCSHGPGLLLQAPAAQQGGPGADLHFCGPEAV
jgi:hypothetical protein